MTGDLRDALKALALASPPGTSIVVTIPRDELLELVNANGNGQAAGPAPAAAAADDRLLSVAEAAVILNTSPRWLYGHGDRLPFTRKLGRRTVRYSERGLRRWMERQRAEREP